MNILVQLLIGLVFTLGRASQMDEIFADLMSVRHNAREKTIVLQELRVEQNADLFEIIRRVRAHVHVSRMSDVEIADFVMPIVRVIAVPEWVHTTLISRAHAELSTEELQTLASRAPKSIPAQNLKRTLQIWNHICIEPFRGGNSSLCEAVSVPVNWWQQPYFRLTSVGSDNLYTLLNDTLTRYIEQGSGSDFLVDFEDLERNTGKLTSEELKKLYLFIVSESLTDWNIAPIKLLRKYLAKKRGSPVELDHVTLIKDTLDSFFMKPKWFHDKIMELPVWVDLSAHVDQIAQLAQTNRYELPNILTHMRMWNKYAHNGVYRNQDIMIFNKARRTHVLEDQLTLLMFP